MHYSAMRQRGSNHNMQLVGEVLHLWSTRDALVLRV
jgi:hypothetical protein